MSQSQLKKNALGLWSIVFFVVAAASPITGVVGAMPIAFMAGNGAGLPAIYLLAGLLLWVFSFGFVAMSRHIVNAGAFYAYVSAGLGRNAGLAGLNVALLTYAAIQVAVVAMFGFFTQLFLVDQFGVNVPWWLCSVIMLVAMLALGIQHVELGGKVLGVLMLAEVGIVLITDIGVLQHVPMSSLEWSSFTPEVAFSGAIGIATIFAISSFIGFEATAIYAEECRDPRRTIPRATFVAVTLIAAFFAFTAWCFVQFHGASQVAAAAAKDPGSFVFKVAESVLGAKAVAAMSLLLITSLFAAGQAFHNAMSRYLFAISRDGFLAPSLSKVHPKHGTPYVASWVQTIVMVAVIAVVAWIQADPMAVVFAWGSALATMGILCLQAAVSLAVIVYFSRRKEAVVSLWSRLIAPALSACGLSIALVLVIKNLNVLSGSESPVIYTLPWVLFAAIGTGLLYAIYLSITQPQRYEKLKAMFEHVA